MTEDAVRRLQSRVRDFSALLATSATWRRRRPADIAAELPSVLVTLLHADVSCVRLSFGGELLQYETPGGSAELFGSVLGRAEVRQRIDTPAGPTYVMAARALDGHLGVLVGARRPAFPTDEEVFLFQMALDQASGALETAHLVERVEAADRRKDHFIAMLGHELRNPLAPIFTALELMAMRGGDTHKRERQVIERQARHLAILVDDLLDISRIVRGILKIKSEILEIEPLLARGIELASPLLEERRHQLHKDVPGDLPRVRGDPVRLSQVVTNLLINAAKYTEPGGEIRLSAARSGERIELRVRDNGIGISLEEQQRIFDLFMRGEAKPGPHGEGLGLGLPLARSLVELHGGTISVESEGRGKGSEFTVCLPAVEAARQRAARPAPAEAEQPGPAEESAEPRVLLVDDNVDAADLMALALESRGFQVHAVHDPVEAIKVAGRRRFDVAVIDLGLPVMDGYELARRLVEGRNPGAGPLRLIAVTGYGQEHDRARTREAGFERHLVKPVEPDELVRALAGG